MNIDQVKKSVPVLMRNNVVPFVWGPQGVGKTQVISQIAKDMNYGFVHLHLATQETGDLVGLLVENGDGTVTHARPQWFPTEGKGIIFLDELNRAMPEVIQAMFSFITSRTIHKHTLPEGWFIVAAGNYQTNQFNVTDTSDAAWLSRFCHIDFTPSKEEFIVYAENNGLDSVADFIRVQPELLEVEPKERFNFNTVTPDRRSWYDMVGKLEKETEIDDIRYELYAGIVGQTAAASFITHKTKALDRLSGRDVLNKYSTIRKKVLSAATKEEVRFDLLNSASEEIFVIAKKEPLKPKQVENLKLFLLDLPLEMGLKVIKKITEVKATWKNEIVNNPLFVERFKSEKLKG